jgi:phage-related protein
MLNQMLGQIPQASQPQLATAITNVAASGASALPPLQQALTSHALPVDIAGIVASAFNTATTALQAALGTVNSVLPTMPAVAQGPIQQVLSMVTSILNTVIGQIGSFVPGAGGSSSGSSASGGLAGGITGIVGGVLSQVQSLLGNLFGNLFGGFGFGSPTVVVNN